jgi:hypothetical protein
VIKRIATYQEIIHQPFFVILASKLNSLEKDISPTEIASNIIDNSPMEENEVQKITQDEDQKMVERLQIHHKNQLINQYVTQYFWEAH